MHTNKGVVVAAAAAVLTLGLAACGSDSGGSAGGSESGPIKIGAVFPLTGPAAPNGDWAKLGTEIAVKDINAAGGIDGRQVEVAYGDDQLEAQKAVTEMTRLVNQEKVDMVLGPLSSDPTLATLPQLKSTNTPSIMGAGSVCSPCSSTSARCWDSACAASRPSTSLSSSCTRPF